MNWLTESWLALSLLSALGLGFYDIFKKEALRGNSVMPVLFLATLAGTVFFTVVSLITGNLGAAFNCTMRQWGLIMVKALIVSSSWICVYYAMRELPISLASPIRASSPVWTLIGGIVIFRELPTPVQAAGMVLIFCGYYAFATLGNREGFSWRSRGLRLIVFGTMLGAVSALYDKYLLFTLQVPRDVMQLHFSIDLVVILGVALLIRRFGFRAGVPFVWRWSIPLTGCALIIADYLYFRAVALPEGQIAIISLVRRSSCVVSFAVGAWYFGDVNIRKKAAALVLILFGILLLTPLWGGH